MVVEVMINSNICQLSHCCGWITINNTFPPIPIIYLLFSLQRHFCHFIHSFISYTVFLICSLLCHLNWTKCHWIIITLQSSTYTHTSSPFWQRRDWGPKSFHRKEVDYIGVTWVTPILSHASIPCISWATHPRPTRGSALHVFLVYFGHEVLAKATAVFVPMTVPWVWR